MAADSYYHPGGDLGWSRSGRLVRVEGLQGAVDFPARRWDRSLRPGDTVDIVVRPSFLGDGYDGRAIARDAGAENGRSRPISDPR